MIGDVPEQPPVVERSRGSDSESNPASRSFNIVVPDENVTSWKTLRPASVTLCTFQYSAFGDFQIRPRK